MKKRIEIKFVDFWDDFNEKENEFVDILSQKYEVIISNTPDYIFYSSFGYEHLKYDCIRIFFTGECYSPNFNICDYAMAFEELEFGDRYIRMPLYLMFQYYKRFEQAQKKHLIKKDELREKTKFCNFIYSNCMADDDRTKFYHMLSEYKHVDSGGRYLNNIGRPVKDKIAFQKKCKFSIAFENCVHNGYTTEKIVEAFAAKTIPIYYGNPNISREFNSAAFINCHEFPNFGQVIARIKEIDENDDLYYKMLQEPINAIDMKIELEKFLFHIFDQDTDCAGRRGNGIHQRMEEKRMRRYGKLYRAIYQPIERIGNVLNKLRKGVIIKRRL